MSAPTCGDDETWEAPAALTHCSNRLEEMTDQTCVDFLANGYTCETFAPGSQYANYCDAECGEGASSCQRAALEAFVPSGTLSPPSDPTPPPPGLNLLL